MLGVLAVYSPEIVNELKRVIDSECPEIKSMLPGLTDEITDYKLPMGAKLYYMSGGNLFYTDKTCKNVICAKSHMRLTESVTSKDVTEDLAMIVGILTSDNVTQEDIDKYIGTIRNYTI
jgi:hypothetical protein